MGSYRGKSSNGKIIFSAVLTGVFVLLICMSLFLEGKAYYIYVTNTPFGTLLYLASSFRYFEEINMSIIFDISYLVILLGMICCVTISIRKHKAIRIVYAVCTCDIVFCLLLSNIFGVVGDVVIIAIAIFSVKGTVPCQGDGSLDTSP